MTSELWGYLFEIKKAIPNIKITMFAIPSLSSKSWIKNIKKKYGWMELHYHGSDHKNKDEWFNKTSINLPYSEFFYPGFKAPWWRIDQITADTLNLKKFIISINREYSVEADKIYQFDLGQEIIPGVCYIYKWKSIHSHIQKQKQKDGLPDIFDDILKELKSCKTFFFISELYEI